MDRLRIGLIGWGTVGAALGELVQRGPLPLTLVSVAVRDATKARDRGLPDGVPLATPEDALDADIVVELAGGLEGPRQWARATLDRGMPYVTANKALLATHGAELAELAERRAAALLGSASVGGGTPMIETVQHLSATGEIERIRGVVNATTTYILSAMGEGRTYADALREAQEAGDAEAAGIRHLAVAAGETVRLVAEATPDLRRVAPTPVDADDPVARATGVESVLEVTVRDAGVFRVSGPGAGGRATAGAVYGDLARLVAGERPILFSA